MREAAEAGADVILLDNMDAAVMREAVAIVDRRSELEPEVLAVLDRNLAQIDAAIVEVRLALDPEGHDVKNHQMLTALYDKKLQILWKASRLSS